MYIYIYIYIYIYRSLGVVSDKIAQLSATPYKREILLLLLRRRRRLLLLLMIIIIGDARGRERDKVIANPGNRDRVRGVSSVCRPWRAIDGTVRGAPLKRRCARSLRRDRSLRAWRDRCF